MISIPIPEGFNMEGREDGAVFEMTVTGSIQDGQLQITSVEGVELEETPDAPEEDVDMDEAALMEAAAGGPAV